MKVVTILNSKGGVGKTTTARNMAYVLSQTYQKKVLVVDMDPNANLSDAFDLKPRNTTQFVGAGLLLSDPDVPIQDVIVNTRYPGIDLIPSNETLADAEQKIRLDPVLSYQRRLRHKMVALWGDRLPDIHYDYCILDSPGNFGVSTVNCLHTSDEAIVVTEADVDSMQMVANSIRTVNKVSFENERISTRGVLFTKVGKTPAEMLLMEQAQKSFGRLLFKTYIRYSSVPKSSRFSKQMCSERQRNSNAAIDYDNFTAEYLGLPFPHDSGGFMT